MRFADRHPLTPTPTRGGEVGLRRLMLVTDGAALGEAAGARRIAAAISGGVDIVQLRDRSASPADLLARAQLLSGLLANTPLIVNDRVDVAMVVGAAGVQLGTGSLPVAEARRLLGRQALIGRSVHSVQEARLAAAEGADYLVVGTIYPTNTHPDQPPEGPPLLEAVSRVIRVPFFAIGGVTAETVGECIKRGAQGVAVIRAIAGADDPEAAAHELRAAIYQALC